MGRQVSFASAAYAGLSFKDTKDMGLDTSASRASVGLHEATSAVLTTVSGVLHSVLSDLLSEKILTQFLSKRVISGTLNFSGDQSYAAYKSMEPSLIVSGKHISSALFTSMTATSTAIGVVCDLSGRASR